MNVSVCIPTLNAGGGWDETLRALMAQDTTTLSTAGERSSTERREPLDVLVIDSSSSDGTAEIARQQGCRVITIPRDQFDHGGTRQNAIDSSPLADVVVFLTQDAVLADRFAISRLTGVFADPSIGAAYGRQLPRPRANAIEAHARLFNYPPVSSVRTLESAKVVGFKAIFFSNSFGAYRCTAMEKVGGFPRPSNFGEDTVVAGRLLQNGWQIAYVSDAIAYHSHHLSYSDEYRRYRSIGELHESERWLLRDFGNASGEGRRFVISEMKYLFRNAPWLIPEAVLRSGLKYLGYKRGRQSRTIPSMK